MYIRLKIKTAEELDAEFLGWSGGNHETHSDAWYMRRLSSFVGKEITDNLPKLYKTFEEIPEHVKLNGYKLHKKYLDWRPSEKKEVHRIVNGLQKFSHGTV